MVNLIIDTPNLVHRAFHAFKARDKEFDLSKQKDVNRLVKNVMVHYASLKREISEGVGNVFFCFDSPSFRKDLSVDYKSNRLSKGNRELDKVFNALYKLIEFKNLNAVKVSGLEADDCIALICKKLLPGDLKIIISQDEDLRQLLDINTFVLTPLSSSRKLYTAKGASDVQVALKISKVEIDPFEILISKTVMGCSGDNIKPLTSKRVRKTLLKKINTDFYSHYLSGESVVTSITLALVKHLNVDENSILYQLLLVWLDNMCMPVESVLEFDKLYTNFHKPSVVELDLNSILTNTIYYSE